MKHAPKMLSGSTSIGVYSAAKLQLQLQLLNQYDTPADSTTVLLTMQLHLLQFQLLYIQLLQSQLLKQTQASVVSPFTVLHTNN